MDDFVSMVRDLLDLGTDLYWTTGLILFFGGLIMFVVEVAGHLLKKRDRPKVVKIEVTQVHVQVQQGVLGDSRRGSRELEDRAHAGMTGPSRPELPAPRAP